MLVRDYLPELGTNLVSALTGLDVYDFTHVESCFCCLVRLLM
jgi:hypothetical protein